MYIKAKHKIKGISINNKMLISAGSHFISFPLPTPSP